MAQNNEEQKKLITEIMELDAKDGLYERETAVEWLFSQIPFEWSSSRGAYDALQIAKQKEKEQIIKAASTVLWSNSSNSTEAAEQYYKETYGKE